MGKLNIMHIVYDLEIGGAQTQILTILQNIDKSKYNPYVLTIVGSGILKDEFIKAGVTVIELGRKKIYDIFAFLRLVNILKKENIHIVHTHLFTANLWGRLAAIIAGTPVIVATEHGIDTNKRALHFALDRLCSRYSHYVTCDSEEISEEVLNIGKIPARQVVRVGTAINIKEFSNKIIKSEARARFGVPQDGFVFGFVARIDVVKGVFYLLEALKLLKGKLSEKKLKIHLLVAGDGPLLGQMKDTAQKLGLSDDITFLGKTREIKAVYSAADALIISSISEGMPVVMLEAMAASLPVVSTSVGSIPSIIKDGENGYLAKPEDPESISTAMFNLIENADKLEKMGKNNFEAVNRDYSVSALISAHEKLYKMARPELYS